MIRFAIFFTAVHITGKGEGPLLSLQADMSALPRRSFSLMALPPRRLWAAGLLFAALLLGLQAVCLWVLPAWGIPTCNLNDILAMVSSLVATLGLLYGATWSARFDRRLGQAWFCFAAGMLGWAIGDTLWAYAIVVRGEVPSASLADLFYFSTYPLFLIGIARFPAFQEKREHLFWTWVDIFIVAAAALGIYWNFLLGPTLLANRPQPDRLTATINLAYPIADILLIAGLAYILFMPRFTAWMRSLSLLLLGQGLITIADSLFTFYTLRGEFSTADSFNILYSLAPIVLLLAGLAQAETVSRRLEEQAPRRESEALYLLRLLTPFLWLAFSYLLLHFSEGQLRGFTHYQNWVWVAGLLTIVALRQIAAALHNRRLEEDLRAINETLEARVAERSAELLRLNAELREQMEEQRRIQALLREREERLAFSATHDALTGLPNRALLVDRLAQAARRYRRHPEQGYALFFLDLDNFKAVNDSLGHLAGDDLLVQVGKRLRTIVRAEDTVARISGDEFVLLAEHCQNAEQAACLAKRVLEVMRDPFTIGGQALYINTSIGVTLARLEQNDPMELLQEADLAMYEAKAGGKGRFTLFSPALRERAVHRLALDSDLRKALETNAFLLHYQPVVALQSGQIVGFEALLRWNHPVRGIIGPAEFLPLAEANGFIHTITEWTLREACRQMQQWKALRPDLSLFISINLSPLSLPRPELLEWIDNDLRSFSIQPHCLRLEIVETALLQDYRIEQALEQMRQRGIEIGLDDFGTGYSSLSSIHKYPIDILKIDRSFVVRLTQNEKLRAIIASIINLARELGLQAIAEGIETRAQYEFLREAGCPLGQGFFLSPPLEAGEAQALLERGGIIGTANGEESISSGKE